MNSKQKQIARRFSLKPALVCKKCGRVVPFDYRYIFHKGATVSVQIYNAGKNCIHCFIDRERDAEHDQKEGL